MMDIDQRYGMFRSDRKRIASNEFYNEIIRFTSIECNIPIYMLDRNVKHLEITKTAKASTSHPWKSKSPDDILDDLNNVY